MKKHFIAPEVIGVFEYRYENAILDNTNLGGGVNTGGQGTKDDDAGGYDEGWGTGN